MTDSELQDLTEDTAPSSAAIAYVVEDPSGTPLSRYMTLVNLLKAVGNLSADTTWAAADSLPFYDNDGSVTDRITIPDFLEAIEDGLSELSAEPADSDTLLVIDGGVAKYIQYSNIRPSPGYALQLNANSINPSDGSTLYMGAPYGLAWTTGGGTARVSIPTAGTITSVFVAMRPGTGGTSENSTISLRLNNTSDTTISTVVDNSASYYVTTAVSVAVVAGDYIEIKWVTPTWETNPLSLQVYASVWVTT